MDKHIQSNPIFCRFFLNLKFEAKLQGGGVTSEMAASLFIYFTQRLVDSRSTSLHPIYGNRNAAPFANS